VSRQAPRGSRPRPNPSPCQCRPVPSPSSSSPSHPLAPGLPRPCRGRARVWVFAGGAVRALAAGAWLAYKQYGKTTPRGQARARSWTDRFFGAPSNSSCGLATWRAWRSIRVPDADSLARLGLLNAFLVDDYAVEAQAKTPKMPSGVPRLAPKTTRKGRPSWPARARCLRMRRENVRRQGSLPTRPWQPWRPILPHSLCWLQRAFAASQGMTSRARRATWTGPWGLRPSWPRGRGLGHLSSRRRRSRGRAASPGALLEKNQDNSRALLLLAEAERALGEPNWVKSLEKACGATPRYRAASAPLARLDRPCSRASTAIAPGHYARPRRFRRPPRIRRYLAQRRFCWRCLEKPTRPRRS
jgi:hypothetical protein